MNREEELTLNWFYCDNIVHPAHEKQVGLLHMGFPRAFVLIRDYGECYFSSFEEFAEHIAEVTFFDVGDKTAENRAWIVERAWNFLALQENAEDEMFDVEEE